MYPGHLDYLVAYKWVKGKAVILFYRVCYFSRLLLQPAFPAEIDDQADSDDEDQSPEIKIPVLPAQLRYMLEVHAVDPGNKSQRDEN